VVSAEARPVRQKNAWSDGEEHSTLCDKAPLKPMVHVLFPDCQAAGFQF